jgi:hypothetical protein
MDISRSNFAFLVCDWTWVYVVWGWQIIAMGYFSLRYCRGFIDVTADGRSIAKEVWRVLYFFG